MAATCFFDRFQGSKNSFPVNGRKVRAKIGDCHVKDLHFWVEDAKAKDGGNPRLRLQIKSWKNEGYFKRFGAKEMDNLLEGDYDGGKFLQQVLDLALSVKEQDGIFEPLLVDSTGCVFEGNRRLAAARMLWKETGNEDWAKVPVRVLGPEFDRRDKTMITAILHVSGKRPWVTYDRAEQANELAEVHNYTTEQIAKHFNWKTSKVEFVLRAYELHTAYHEEYGDFSPRNWTIFDKLARSTRLYGAMTEPSHDDYDPDLWDKFKRAVYMRLINDCQHVNALLGTFKGKTIEILKHPTATAILFNERKKMENGVEVPAGGSLKAIEWVKNNVANDPVMNSCNNFLTTLKNIAPKETKKFCGNSLDAQERRNVIEAIEIEMAKLKRDFSITA